MRGWWGAGLAQLDQRDDALTDKAIESSLKR